MKVPAENKALKDNQREFVHLIVHKSMSKEDAYCIAFNVENCRKNKSMVSQESTKELKRPNVNAYYTALLSDVTEKEEGKALWTREVATERLIKLIDRAEKEVYGDEKNGIEPKNITMSRLNAIMLPIKELNQMNGYNQINTKIEGTLVQIVGEDELLD